MRKFWYLVPFAAIVALFFAASLFRDLIDVPILSDLKNISFAIAFLGGVLSIFSPCTVAVVPAFLSYAFKEKRQVGRVTIAFFLGFSSAFIVLGLLIAYLGKISFVYFQNTSSDIIVVIGFLLVIFGLMSFFGRGFTFISLGLRPKHDFFGLFLFGVLFAVGWSACSGPIIAGIISIAAAFSNYAYSALLLFFYSLGIAVPLFFMAFAYDAYKLSENPLIRGKSFHFSVLGNEFNIHSTNAVSGLMLIGLGVLFIFYKGTTVLTGLDLLGRFIVLVLLIVFAYIAYRLIVVRVVSGSNARHVVFFMLFIGAVLGFRYLDSKYVITTVGYAEFFDRVMLQNSLFFNIFGVLFLFGFLFLVWKLAFRNKK